jgi:hypothetical protein
MDRLKYPPVDPKSVDGASRADQIEGYTDVPASEPGYFFDHQDRTVSGKGIPQNDRGGFCGRAHGWER